MRACAGVRLWVCVSVLPHWCCQHGGLESSESPSWVKVGASQLANPPC